MNHFKTYLRLYNPTFEKLQDLNVSWSINTAPEFPVEITKTQILYEKTSILKPLQAGPLILVSVTVRQWFNFIIEIASVIGEGDSAIQSQCILSTAPVRPTKP